MMKNVRMARGESILPDPPDLDRIHRYKDMPERGTPRGKENLKIAGNLEAQAQEELRKAFKRPIKKAGGYPNPASALPYRTPQRAKDKDINV